MKLKQFLETYCDKSMDVDVTDDWGEDYTIHYEGSVERLLKYTDIYAEELKRKVKAVDASFDGVLMILVEAPSV